ncbi:hypothetical protein [Plantibacter sp. CFBP 13570]|uniref:hypothetical protein n=1 Tax=Plantibacter sp. CFBP 13570 TaxID=2775272 RepID=UPI001930D1E1|nr:hypothetical protein [Plantibacter sp. CFBP 13570]MBD8535659.1 hypothetical protein [Plantibacter sp. CFBP 13570]
MTNTSTDPAPARPTSRRAAVLAWMRRHTLGKILAVVAAAAVLITAVVITNAVAANAEFEDKLTSARGAVKALGQAEIHNNAQKIALDAEITRTLDTSAAVATIVAGAPAYFDTSAAAELEQARLALDAAVTAVKTPPAEGQPAASTTLEPASVDRILPKDPTLQQLTAFQKTLAAAIRAVEADTDRKDTAIDTLVQAREDLRGPLRNLANTVVTVNAPAVRAFAPAVDITAFNDTVTALQITIDDNDPLIPPLETYETAAKTVLDAQTAINTQAAIDAANQAGNDSYVDPSTGEAKPNPNYNGGGSGSGSGGGSGGGSADGGSSGSGGGGDSGSGGGAPAAPTPPRIVYTSYACGGAGGYSESSYNNRGITVPGSGVASVNGPYDSGSGWRVDWTCG